MSKLPNVFKPSTELLFDIIEQEEPITFESFIDFNKYYQLNLVKINEMSQRKINNLYKIFNDNKRYSVVKTTNDDQVKLTLKQKHISANTDERLTGLETCINDLETQFNKLTNDFLALTKYINSRLSK